MSTEPPPPFPTSLCHECARERLVRSARGSVFVQCTSPAVTFRYPPQPVRACAAFEPRVAASEQPGDPDSATEP
jgi:hypothetical protein